tara:strand:+ start:5724 stop:6356 length:633 start_codon:yes stop_codon:yes gene_type:complete
MAGTTKRKPDATNEVSGTGVPKRLKAEMRKQRIIEAAIDLFSKNSFEDTRIDEIAAAANCTTGPVYHFFDGKEEIFIAAYSEVAHRYALQLRDALASEKEPLEKIVDICNRFHDLPAGQASEFARSGLRVLGYREVLERQRGVRTAIGDLLRQAMMDGTIQPAPPEPLANLIFGMAIEALSLIGISDDGDKALWEYQNAIEMLVHGLRLH